MNEHYHTLQTLYNIVKDDGQPETYKCLPREIILKGTQSWNLIEKNLLLLEKEGLLKIRKEDSVVIFITVAGIKIVEAERKFQF